MTRSALEIAEWLQDYVGKLVRIPPRQIEDDVEFTAYGLDSASGVGLSVDLGEWLGMSIDPTIIYDYTTIAQISDHLASNSVQQMSVRA